MRIEFRSFALGLALSAVVAAARADDVVVTGTLDHLRIEASGAPIIAVLEALKKQFGVAYRYRVRPDWTVDGTFTGSLSSVLPRVFRDRNYVVRIEPDQSMTVFLASPQGPEAAAPIPSPQGPPTAAAPAPPPVQALSNPADERARKRWAHPPDPPDD
ncbi:MAG TPA: hypothetical protein VFE63_09105 [Roseiarcus sp.]|jgi:hypothetical protein|nr:hypothetical protein [Roseiarcus sp.]